VRQAEEMLGVALHQRRIELQVALRLERVLHAHEQPQGEFAPGRGRPLIVNDGESSSGSRAASDGAGASPGPG
jgi:hypothetical protein